MKKIKAKYAGRVIEATVTHDIVDRLSAFYDSVMPIERSNFFNQADTSLRLKVDFTGSNFEADGTLNVNSPAPILFSQGFVDDEHWDAFLIRMRHVCLQKEPGYVPSIVKVLSGMFGDRQYADAIKEHFTTRFLNNKPEFAIGYQGSNGKVDLYSESFFQDYLNAFAFHSAPDIRKKFADLGFDLGVGLKIVRYVGMEKAETAVKLAHYVKWMLKELAASGGRNNFA